LPVGYGDSGAQPWNFRLSKGLTADIIYFKLFVTTKPTDLSFICQGSPFSDANARALYQKPRQKAELDLWGTVTVAVLQRHQY
jgi:hypothetical protein